ncbi:MAG: recombinase family protein [Oscillospiraceae bacterium]|nr:recombinase family protein [Oscillospiraceae bacterium]
MARKSRKNIYVNDNVQSMKKASFDAGAYIRISGVVKKDKSDSIETQQAIIGAYIAERPDIELREIYIDNGLSGQSFERPAFQQMIADMESGRINCCITKDLSRIGRNAIDTGYYIEKYFPSLGVRFISVNDDYDSSDGQSGGIVLSLKNMINETYAIDIGRKQKATRQLLIREGGFVGKVPPYGYMKSQGDCHKLIIDPYAAPVIIQIYQMYSDGNSTHDILAYLNDNSVLPPYRYFYSKGWTSAKDTRNGVRWKKSTVCDILQNRVYCGDMVQGKFVRIDHVLRPIPKDKWFITENTHEAIIGREIFEQIQEKLKIHKEKQALKRFSTPSSINIFRRKMYCGHCGYAMIRRRFWEDSYSFKCGSKNAYGSSDCGDACINEKALKETIFTMLHKQAAIFVDHQAAIDEQPDNSMKNELRDIQVELKRNKGFFQGLYESLVSGDIGSGEYMELKNSYEAKLASLTERERNLRDSIIKQSADELKGRKAAKSICGLKNVNDLNAGVLDSLIEKISFYGDGHIEIRFRFIDETAEVMP